MYRTKRWLDAPYELTGGRRLRPEPGWVQRPPTPGVNFALVKHRYVSRINWCEMLPRLSIAIAASVSIGTRPAARTGGGQRSIRRWSVLRNVLIKACRAGACRPGRHTATGGRRTVAAKKLGLIVVSSPIRPEANERVMKLVGMDTACAEGGLDQNIAHRDPKRQRGRAAFPC